MKFRTKTESEYIYIGPLRGPYRPGLLPPFEAPNHNKKLCVKVIKGNIIRATVGI
jgi:hypothetical protein